LRYRRGGGIGANKLSLSTNIVGSTHFPKLQYSHLAYTGLYDYWGLNFYPEKAMSGFDASKANIALCHNPDVCDLDFWDNYNSWILSGHTHGGQVKPPFLPAPMLPVKNRKYSSGQIELSKNRTLYINRALGHLWQVRFNVRPELTIFELQQG
jgi:predicted MPP superfamily phosphohydrolase